MKQSFKIGDRIRYQHQVISADFATFPTGNVHEVYGTFALTRDAEWCTRQFVLEMKEEDEEGIGTFVEVTHHSPAFEADLVIFEGLVEAIEGNEIICSFKARVKERLIASGRTGQKILKKETVKKLFDQIKNG